MCHLILIMPVLGLAAFWLWPLAVAVPVYAVVLALSLWLYWLMLRSMRQPAQTGMEAILRARGTVVAREGRGMQVRVRGELWTAESSDALRPGDPIAVVGADGLRLKVRRQGVAARPPGERS